MKKNYTNPEADRFYASLLEDPAKIPFSFTYAGRDYTGLGGDVRITPADTGDSRESAELCMALDESLELCLLITHYPTHGVTEWTARFTNPSDHDSGLLENPHVKLSFAGAYPTLKGILGDHVNQYRPYSVDLTSMPASFESSSGRATHINFPYFNLEYGDGGVMLAIGWAGTWRADFIYDGGATAYTARSVNNLRTVLRPGEEIRTALFVVAPYTVRNENYAVNYWRDWFIGWNLPKADADGHPLAPFSTCCLCSDTGLPNSDGSISENHASWRPSLEKMIAENCKVDFRWFDAGWYMAPDKSSAVSYEKGHDWWDTVGTWELDPAKWPGDSFRKSTDFARENGMKTLMWFEPERVTDPESLAENFGYNPEWAIRREGVRAISNNIGDEACYNWTVSRITKTLRENRVEMYREDNNCDAAGLWKWLDEREGENRQGITECKFIGAHYRMWDDIIACTLSHGGCGFVDSCASGGGRNDLESMRRGVPLLRSDADRESTGLRLSMTTAFNAWIPFCGANTKEKKYQLDKTGISDVYVWRASYLPILNVDSQFVYDESQNFDILRLGLDEWKRVRPYLLCDFYRLTPWHGPADTSGFTAFAYYDEESKKGVLLAFRQEKCAEAELRVRLPFLDAGGCFVLRDEDSGEMYAISRGEDLSLTFDAPRTARLLWIDGN